MTKDEELKQLIEDAAKLLGHRIYFTGPYPPYIDGQFGLEKFNPLDPERGDLMKVAMATRLNVDLDHELISAPLYNNCGMFLRTHHEPTAFNRDDHQSLALAILRAASAVLHSRGGM